ncbi:hypothetical protein A8C56_11365 [Niabella ginsenosidivorans]|uniref:Uncharacterized protein n=1 Tax=Niabella ginsenosidivorans TaxID=1176587 RepID=A0A1A9I1J3_9BACT|nr:hypothetical protein [Niabella ginsenosidivorans]ANH81496.1 hypothetical protein A8C56_11365 [Niabella ginsenosidivorans]
MTKPIIRSHEDLLIEKERLKASLKQRKTDLKESFSAIKDELNPIAKAARTTRDIFTADNDFPLIGLGVEKLTDLIIRKGILRKAGWLPRLVAPFLVKKISTYLIAVQASGQIAEKMHAFAGILRGSHSGGAGTVANNKLPAKAADPKKNVGNKVPIN